METDDSFVESGESEEIDEKHVKVLSMEGLRHVALGMGERMESIRWRTMRMGEKLDAWAAGNRLGRAFRFKERGARFTIELRAGLITFLMTAYILAVNPNILGTTGGTCTPQDCTYPQLGMACLADQNDSLAVDCLEQLKTNLITATAASSLISTFLIGYFGNLPLAMAPGLGISTYVAYQVVGQLGAGQLTYSQVMAAIFVEGWIFILMSITGVRGGIIRLMPKSIAMASTVGIGLLLAFTGLVNLGVIVFESASLVALGGCNENSERTYIYQFDKPLTVALLQKLTDEATAAAAKARCCGNYSNPLSTVYVEALNLLPAAVYGCQDGVMRSPTMWLGISGGLLMSMLLFMGVKGALIIGIAFVTIISWIPGHAATYLGASSPIPGGEERFDVFKNVVALPTLDMMGLAWDWSAFNSGHLWLALFTFLYIDLLDCTGTLFSMARLLDATMPGFMDENMEFPGQMWAFLSDGVGIIVGSMMGSTPLTVFIESAAGIEDGGRTGLTAIVVSFFFFVSLFFSPILASIPPYATGPALILVGTILLGHIAHIEWDDVGHAIPAFLTIVLMPFTYSVAYGVIAGLGSYLAIHLPFWIWGRVTAWRGLTRPSTSSGGVGGSDGGGLSSLPRGMRRYSTGYAEQRPGGGRVLNGGAAAAEPPSPTDFSRDASFHSTDSRRSALQAYREAMAAGLAASGGMARSQSAASFQASDDGVSMRSGKGSVALYRKMLPPSPAARRQGGSGGRGEAGAALPTVAARASPGLLRRSRNFTHGTGPPSVASDVEASIPGSPFCLFPDVAADGGRPSQQQQQQQGGGGGSFKLFPDEAEEQRQASGSFKLFPDIEVDTEVEQEGKAAQAASPQAEQGGQPGFQLFPGVDIERGEGQGDGQLRPAEAHQQFKLFPDAASGGPSSRRPDKMPGNEPSFSFGPGSLGRSRPPRSRALSRESSLHDGTAAAELAIAQAVPLSLAHARMQRGSDAGGMSSPHSLRMHHSFGSEAPVEFGAGTGVPTLRRSSSISASSPDARPGALASAASGGGSGANSPYASPGPHRLGGLRSAGSSIGFRERTVARTTSLADIASRFAAASEDGEAASSSGMLRTSLTPGAGLQHATSLSTPASPRPPRPAPVSPRAPQEAPQSTREPQPEPTSPPVRQPASQQPASQQPPGPPVAVLHSPPARQPSAAGPFADAPLPPAADGAREQDAEQQPRMEVEAEAASSTAASHGSDPETGPSTVVSRDSDLLELSMSSAFGSGWQEGDENVD
eukprot:scaffold18.g1986.t1